MRPLAAPRGLLCPALNRQVWLQVTQYQDFPRGYFVSIGNNSPKEKLHFKVLAPFRADVPQALASARVDEQLHSKFIFEIQIVRGLALRELGHITTHLLPDGRHYQPIDFQSWHVLLHNDEGRVMGCARYRPVMGGFDQLGASQSAIAYSNRYGPLLKAAVDRQIESARKNNVQYGEAGCWALRREIRGCTAAINIALMTWTLAHHLGGGMGITTASRTNHSASILRRLGARRLANLPAYYEPKFGSIIEILAFNKDHLDDRFAARMGKLKSEICQLPVICAADAPLSSTPGVLNSAPAIPAYQTPETGGYGVHPLLN